jgi:aryl-alcohol dehydrogenase-like predicted oxidoreductase
VSLPSPPLAAPIASLSRVALGCGNFGGVGSAPEFFGQGMNQAEALALMDAAWELGIRHFDTADAYGGGRSERAIGAWIASRGVLPGLTTKTYNPMSAGGDSGLEPERIRRQLEGSLQRLGVERVDCYLAHEFDPDVPVAVSQAAFGQLVTDGLIGSYGLSNVTAARLQAALQAGEPAVVQNSFSLLDQGDADELLPLCARHGIAYEVYGPLMGGWLTGKYERGAAFPAGSRMTQRPEPYAELATDATFDALDGLRELSQSRGSSMAGTALAWLLADERVTRVVVGPGRPAHLDPIVEAVKLPLSASERDTLTERFS